MRWNSEQQHCSAAFGECFINDGAALKVVCPTSSRLPFLERSQEHDKNAVTRIVRKGLLVVGIRRPVVAGACCTLNLKWCSPANAEAEGIDEFHGVILTFVESFTPLCSVSR